MASAGGQDALQPATGPASGEQSNKQVSSGARLRATGSMNRAPSGDNQEIFVLPRQKSRSRDRRESRMFLVDGQLCWADDMSQPAGFAPGKRNSSIGLMFGSSMDLSGIGQSIDSSGGAGSGSEEAISYRIKWCRENILQLKRQCWPMEKKLQVLRASKLFIKQHQGELKQSKQAKDVIASTSAIFERYWRHFKREFANFLVIITPWEMRIKKIESHFGSVVASYFTFLRWIFWLNLANSLVMCTFVMVPELIENVPDLTGMRKGELGMYRAPGERDKVPEFNPTLSEMWEFEGFLKFSPIFYGYYSNIEISRSGFWRNPLSFLLSAMFTYLFCFFCISRKLSQNTKLSRIGTKDDEYTFCWTVFVGWDFMIGNSETAYNKTSSLVMNLKEGILEEKEQTKDRDWRLIIRRVFANMLTIMLIVASAYVVTLAVQRSENLPEDASLLQKNELQLVMSGIQFMFPPLFDVIGIIEKYHPRKALSWQLGRILFLDFLNFYTLMFSLFGTVDQMGNQLNEVSGNITLLRKNATYYSNLFTTTTTSTTTTTTTTSTTTPPETHPNTNQQMDIINSPSPNASQVLNGSTLSTILESTQFSLAPTGQPENNPSSVGLNGSSILTSVLLASSTIMPSTMTINSTSLLPTPTGTLSGSISVHQIEPTTVAPSLASTSLNWPVETPPTSAIVSATSATLPVGATSRQSATYLATLVYKVETTTPVDGGLARGAPATTSSGGASAPKEDEDYPDINEALGRKRKRRRKKRWARESGRQSYVPANSGDEIERDDSVLIDPRLVTQPAGHPLPTATSRKQTHQQLAVGLPPIQDPYGQLGQTFRPRLAAHPLQAGDQILDQDEEEPLEGRLEVSAPSGRRPTTMAPSIRRPLVETNGRARPIGGKSASGRVQLMRPTTQVGGAGGDALLDSDTDDELVEAPAGQQQVAGQASPASQDSAHETGALVEPTTGPAPSSVPTILSTDDGQSEAGGPQELSSTARYEGAPMGRSALGAGPPGASTNDIGYQAMVPVAGASVTIMAPGSEPISVPVCTTSPATYATAPTTTDPPNSSFGFDTNSTTHGALAAWNLRSSSIGFNASEVSYSDCIEIPDFKHQEILALNDTLRDKLKSLCWETMFGQEMVKIVVMDLVMTVVSAVSFEFMRACFVRYCNRFFFWDLERGFPGYQDFKIAENVLHLVNNQSTVWMGMFFAPGLPAINTVKLAVLMYVRSWAVLTCNIPHETVFKVSKSNNFYYWILLINLLICILPVAYAVTWIRPSWHCGPFGGECRMYIVVTKLVKQLLPPEANSVFRYITSPGAVIPILISLILIIYYLASTVSSSKEANKELKAQLKKDKEQEAAVPEITNTTVADPAPGTAASVIAGGVQPAGSALGAPVAASATNVGQQSVASGAETRPKSLLVPPAPI